MARPRAFAGVARFARENWAGGINLSDHPGELEENESPSCLNVSFDDTGAIVKRLGFASEASISGVDDYRTLYYSDALGGQTVAQIGRSLYKHTGVGTWSNFHTFASAPGRVTFVDFNGLLYFVAPNFGVYSYNGTTVTERNTTVRGSALAAWQNRLWACGEGNSVPSRLWFSNLGDGNTWTTAQDFVDIRDVNDERLTALHVAPTGALLAFKRHSTHRIVDSETGANSTIDPTAGAGGATAVDSNYGIVCAVDDHGIHLTDGLSELQHVSQKIEPLFEPMALNQDASRFFTVAAHGENFYIGIRRAGKTANDLTLEFSPRFGWFAPHSFGLTAMVTPHGDLPLGIVGASDQEVMTMFTGGTDDGAPVSCHYETKLFHPAGGGLTRLRRLRVHGRGSFDLFFKRDYDEGLGERCPIAISAPQGFIWGDAGAIWGDSDTVWGAQLRGGYDDCWSLGTSKRLQIRLQQTGSSSTLAPKMLGDGVAEEVGEIAMFGFILDHVPLGLA